MILRPFKTISHHGKTKPLMHSLSHQLVCNHGEMAKATQVYYECSALRVQCSMSAVHYECSALWVQCMMMVADKLMRQ